MNPVTYLAGVMSMTESGLALRGYPDAGYHGYLFLGRYSIFMSSPRRVLKSNVDMGAAT